MEPDQRLKNKLEEKLKYLSISLDVEIVDNGNGLTIIPQFKFFFMMLNYYFQNNLSRAN